MRLRVIGTLMVLATLFQARFAPAQKADEDAWFKEFARIDQTASKLIEAVDCVNRLGEALNQGTFSRDSTLGPDYQCIEEGGRKLAILAQIDSTASQIFSLAAMDREDLSRYYGRVDTIRVQQMLKASVTAIRGIRSRFEEKKRDYAPFTITGPGDSIEVWLLPVELVLEQMDSPVAGGEYGAVFSAHGDSLVRSVDEIDQQHIFSPPATGVVRIGDLHRRLPFVSELMVARWLSASGRTVSVETGQHRSTLGGKDAVWLHFTRSEH